MLDRIRAVGVQLDVGAGELICEAPLEVRTPRGWLERYKVELLQLLQPERHNWVNTPEPSHDWESQLTLTHVFPVILYM